MDTNTWAGIISLVVAVVSAFIAGRIAGSKGHSAVGFGVLGFFLPLVGIIVAVVLKPKQTV